MSLPKVSYSKGNYVHHSSHVSSRVQPLFPSTELLNKDLTMYYLQNLPECRINVAKGLALLYELEESEDQIYQAVTLQSRSFRTVGRESSEYPEQGLFRVQEECEKEKLAMQKERTLLQEYLKYENQKLVILEGSIYSLPEPHRSVIIARYLERMSWNAIQKKFKRSASRIFVLNKEGIYAIHDAISAVNNFTALTIHSDDSAKE